MNGLSGAQPSGSGAPEPSSDVAVAPVPREAVGAPGSIDPSFRPATVVDMHTHYFPAGIADLAFETGDSRWPSLSVNPDGSARIMRGAEVFRPVAETCWNLARRAEAMDVAGIDHHVLSPVPVTLTTWAEPVLAARFARMQNEAFADAVARSVSLFSGSSAAGVSQDRISQAGTSQAGTSRAGTSSVGASGSSATGRFSWIGCVPLQDTDAAIVELAFGVNELGMLGVEIGSEISGRELDDPSLRPFFAAAQDLDVAIFIHPTDGAGAIRRGGIPYEFGLGMLTDTAMAAAALVFGGVLDEFPKLRIGLAHGCGSFAWSYPRLVRGASMNPANGTPDSISAHTEELLRRLWVDTLVFDPEHMPLLMARFGADHLMLGSDFPFYPPTFGSALEPITGAVACNSCTPTQATSMLGPNANTFLQLNTRLSALRNHATS
jgi:aminocarboxymuconate-semialdehyde decarboxylase